MTGYVFDDGGRHGSGRKGKAGDCVCRSIAIATGLPYDEVYSRLAEGRGAQRKTSRTTKKSASARDGINTGRKWFKDYMRSLGFRWIPTMQIGQGCKVHLCAEELPAGRLVVAVSGHYTAVIDGIIHDTHDPRRSKYWITEPDNGQPLKTKQSRNANGVHTEIGGRCVYGYWTRDG